MKLILRNIKPEDWQEAVNVALDWNKWHNTPERQRHETIMARKYIVHETETGTVVIRYRML